MRCPCELPVQVPQWSRIGRLKRNTFPKLTGGGNVFGGGASPGVMTCIAGRLLCDTYLSSRCAARRLAFDHSKHVECSPRSVISSTCLYLFVHPAVICCPPVYHFSVGGCTFRD